MEDKWLPSGARCTRCGRETLYKVRKTGPNTQEVVAERCPKCKWVVKFEFEEGD
jgi:ssDNA-binding Zn-finger/Zn-ribbon topoisomerase 1